jgi:hypothetical protein
MNKADIRCLSPSVETGKVQNPSRGEDREPKWLLLNALVNSAVAYTIPLPRC